MTQEQQDSDLADAQTYLSCASVTVDRCRHESIDLTTLWLFDKDRKQIGSLARFGDGWRASHMRHGMPTSCVTVRTMLDGIGHIMKRDKGK